jgi:hypothetical protein
MPLRVPSSPDMPIPFPSGPRPSETDYLMALSVMKKLGKFDKASFADRMEMLSPADGQVEDRRGNEASDAAEAAAAKVRGVRPVMEEFK